MARIELAAEASFAAMRARSRLGIAIEAIIKMIETTISNSTRENPFCFLIVFSPMANGSHAVDRGDLSSDRPTPE
jgi:hypothetical protein